MRQKNIDLPEFIKDTFKTEFGVFPSETFFGGIKKEGIDILLKKNKLIWFKREIVGGSEVYNEGTIVYGTNKIHIYFKKNEDELVYKVLILSDAKGDDSLIQILINGLKQYLVLI